MNLSLDILSCIFYHLPDYSVFSFCQLNKSTANLRRKDKLWKIVWNDRYPYNDLIPELSVFQNYKRLVLVQKFLELNEKILKHWHGSDIKHSKTPRRDPNRALFIPMVGYNWKHAGDKILPISLKTAFASVNVRILEEKIKWDKDLCLAQWLYSSDNLMIRPKPGDILAFVELASDSSETLYIFDGKEIEYSFGVDSSCYPTFKSWPEIALNYYHWQSVVPTSVKDDLFKNLQYQTLPVIIPNVRTDVYSFCERNGKIFYVVFRQSSLNIQYYDFDSIWDWNRIFDYNEHFGTDKTMLIHVCSTNNVEYIIFEEPDW